MRGKGYAIIESRGGRYPFPKVDDPHVGGGDKITPAQTVSGLLDFLGKGTEAATKFGYSLRPLQAHFKENRKKKTEVAVRARWAGFLDWGASEIELILWRVSGVYANKDEL